MILNPEDRSPEQEALYRRLVISHFDLAEAAQFLNQLKALNQLQLDDADERQELRRALTIASVIAYSRPFSNSYGAPDTARSISIEDVENIGSQELTLHASIILRRNQTFAHSDAETAALWYDRAHPNGPVPYVTDPRVAFTFNQVVAFHALAAKLSIWTASRATQISGVYVIGSRRAAPSDG